MRGGKIFRRGDNLKKAPNLPEYSPHRIRVTLVEVCVSRGGYATQHFVERLLSDRVLLLQYSKSVFVRIPIQL